MLNDIDTSRMSAVYLACGYTDLRCGIDALAGSVENRFSLNPFEKNILFLFCGRKCDRIKGLIWEGDGFLLLYKRLENGKFKWPRTSEEAVALSPQQLRWLMDGLSIYQKHSVSEVQPKRTF